MKIRLTLTCMLLITSAAACSSSTEVYGLAQDTVFTGLTVEKKEGKKTVTKNDGLTDSPQQVPAYSVYVEGAIRYTVYVPLHDVLELQKGEKVFILPSGRICGDNGGPDHPARHGLSGILVSLAIEDATLHDTTLKKKVPYKRGLVTVDVPHKQWVGVSETIFTDETGKKVEFHWPLME